MPKDDFRDEELLADVICRLIGNVRHVAVGVSSPIPATAALLARERGGGRPYVSLLGSRAHTFFSNFELLVICGLCKLSPQCEPIHVTHRQVKALGHQIAISLPISTTVARGNLK
jgi:hypothetical protein